MFYRTNLALHSARVQQIVQRLLPFALQQYPELDVTKTLLISKFHDDYEMTSNQGDVSLQIKMRMDGQQISLLKQEEIAAAEFLVRSYGNPEIEGYAYRDLLMHAILKDCPEAQLHSFADKLDGYGEAIHEVLAGNTCFVEPVINYVAKSFNNPHERFPLIAKAFDSTNGPFSFPVVCLKKYFEHGLITTRPHTQASLMRKTEIPHYEMWKEVTLGLPNGLEVLTQQLEFQGVSLPLAPEIPKVLP